MANASSGVWHSLQRVKPRISANKTVRSCRRRASERGPATARENSDLPNNHSVYFRDDGEDYSHLTHGKWAGIVSVAMADVAEYTN